MDNPSAPPPLPADVAPAKTSGMAIASFVLGLIGILTCGITFLISAPVGLVLGIIAMGKIGKSQGELKGKGLALAGVIMSAVTFLMIPIIAAMMLPALASAHDKAREINCINSEKQLALAILMYSGDHTNHFPVAAKWCDAIQPMVRGKKTFKSEAANPSSRCDYAFNANLDGIDTSSVKHPAETVLLFESDAGWNASGGSELFPAHSRYGSGSRNVFIIAFVDGHVEAVTPTRANSLVWDPNQ